METSNFDVTSELIKNKLIIRVNNIIHFVLTDVSRIFSLITYFEGDSCHIEIYINERQCPLKLEYDKEYKWIQIINELEKYTIKK